MADFGIALESNPVYAGSIVKGQIWANVRQGIKGTFWNVVFSGNESTTVRYTHTETRPKLGSTTGETETRTETRYAHDYRNIIQIQIPVNDNAISAASFGRIEAGRYVFPFQVELPSFLPPSMTESRSGGSFKIQYRIKAILKSSGVLWNYNCEQEVYILQKPVLLSENNRTPYAGPPNLVPITVCCCMDRGTMAMGAYMSTTVLPKSQPASLCFECRNYSSVDILSVTAELIQVMYFTALRHHESSIKTLYTDNILGHRLSGLEKKRKSQIYSKNNASSYTQEEIQRERAELWEILQSGKNATQILVPADAITSYQGSLIKISHHIRLRVNTKACIENPEIQIPVSICGVVVLPATSTQPALSAPSAPVEETPPTVQGQALPPEFSEQDVVVFAEAVYVDSEQGFLSGEFTPAAAEVPDGATNTSPPALSAPPVSHPGMKTLSQAMSSSIGDVEVVHRFMNDSAWKSFFQTLSPNDYGSIIRTVQSSFDEVPLAVRLACGVQASVKGGVCIEHFTCSHVVSAVQSASEFNRTAMVEKLIEFCKDLQANHSSIETILTAWEKTVTQRAFEKALSGGKN